MLPNNLKKGNAVMRNSVKTGIILMAVFLVLGSFSFSVAGEQVDGRSYGARLYEKFCSGCHQSLEDSVKAGRSEERIKSAIRRLSSHSRFARMSERQISAIASVLRDVSL